VAGRLALARGERERAAALLARAEREAPGDTLTVLTRAVFDAATGSADAPANLARLRDLDRRLPLAFLRREVASLERADAAPAPREALFELESAVLCDSRPEQEQKARKSLAEAYRRSGQPAKALEQERLLQKLRAGATNGH
jgi:hypothetical protein